jgi:hypothetical protein
LALESGHEKYLLTTTTAEDKFLFNITDEIINKLQKEFKEYNYDRDYIFDALKGNSMDLCRTYLYLRKPAQSK